MEIQSAAVMPPPERDGRARSHCPEVRRRCCRAPHCPADVVELRQGQVLDHFKSGSAIVAAVHSSIGSGIHPVRIFYVKDHIMNIGVHTPQAFEGLSSVP